MIDGLYVEHLYIFTFWLITWFWRFLDLLIWKHISTIEHLSLQIANFTWREKTTINDLRRKDILTFLSASFKFRPHYVLPGSRCSLHVSALQVEHISVLNQKRRVETRLWVEHIIETYLNGRNIKWAPRPWWFSVRLDNFSDCWFCFTLIVKIVSLVQL